MSCKDGDETFDTGTKREIGGVMSVCTADGRWLPIPDGGTPEDARSAPRDGRG
jgi:hypothetical protein